MTKEEIAPTPVAKDGMIATPFGYKAASDVWIIDPRLEIEEKSADGLEYVEVRNPNSNDTWKFQLPLDESEGTVGDVTGWNLSAEWINQTGDLINDFVSSWEVPLGPAIKNPNVQTIFLFNGIQKYGRVIIQPVLKWDGKWSIASWCVYYGKKAPAFKTEDIDVNVKDQLMGIILTSSNAGKITYSAEFGNKPLSRITYHRKSELTVFTHALESDNTSDCSHFPNTDKTVFSIVKFADAQGPTSCAWTPSPPNHNLPCNTLDVSVTGGQVEIIYK
jgi:hypothetical protein